MHFSEFSFIFSQKKKLSIVPPRASIESFFLHFIITCSSAPPFGSLHFRKAVFLPPALSPSLPVSPDAHDFVCRFVYYIQIITLCFFVLFLQRRRFLAILYAFFVYFYVLSKILREFFVQNKISQYKKENFSVFFFCCQKISLNKPFSPLPSLFCHCALPCSAGKAAN